MKLIDPTQEDNAMVSILVGSPVRQKNNILTEFLKGLEDADTSGLAVSYCFVDDNTDTKSTELLREFACRHNTFLLKGDELVGKDSFGRYSCDDGTHHWDNKSITKVAFFKDTIIDYGLERQYDYLFLVDSDIVIDRRTYQQLLSDNVEIVSNIFWTQWQPNWEMEAQCFWIPSIEERYKKPFSRPIPIEEARQHRRDFFSKLRVPGLYKVEGLGACTMISRKALEKGVRFREIPNLSMLGEDRHFCIRAGVLDIPLYLDTVYPVYHIYREEYLTRVDEFKKNGFNYEMCQTFDKTEQISSSKASNAIRIIKKGLDPIGKKIQSRRYAKLHPRLCYDYRIKKNEKIAMISIVNDDSIDLLPKAIKRVYDIVDGFVILDATSAETISADCEHMLRGKQYSVISRRGTNVIKNEEELRRLLWKEAESFEPGWILSLDADEILQENADHIIPHLIRNKAIDSYRFNCYTMWDENCFVAEGPWHPEKNRRSYLMRFKPGFSYHWSENEMGRIKTPNEEKTIPYANINLIVQDYSLSKEKKRNKCREAFVDCYKGKANSDEIHFIPREEAKTEPFPEELPVL